MADMQWKLDRLDKQTVYRVSGKPLAKVYPLPLIPRHLLILQPILGNHVHGEAT